MRDLVAFLLARIAEDEEVARACLHPDGDQTLTWLVAGVRHSTFDNGRGESYVAVRCGDWERILVARDRPPGRLAVHIARHDPARVLAEIAAKRRIVAWHEQDVTGSGIECATCGWYPAECGGCETLQLLALPFADHPDYRQEWKP